MTVERQITITLKPPGGEFQRDREEMRASARVGGEHSLEEVPREWNYRRGIKGSCPSKVAVTPFRSGEGVRTMRGREGVGKNRTAAPYTSTALSGLGAEAGQHNKDVLPREGSPCRHEMCQMRGFGERCRTRSSPGRQ